MTPHQRFVVWKVVVTAPLVLSPVWALSVRSAPFADVTPLVLISLVGFTAVAVAIALLILTTPADAICLSAGRSVTSIGIATGWLSLWMWVGIGGSCHSAFVPIATMLLAAALVQANRTPWWAAVASWNPLVVAPFFWPSLWPVIVLFVLAATISCIASFRRPV